ncbi:MAG: hypothetical protein EXX96DRAFT_252383 [Benjaminiella poitrasii]|nr:MAG: hypothetical protein EXX96DRAFT_252383 [Benjaminiella poitrasii]
MLQYPVMSPSPFGTATSDINNNAEQRDKQPATKLPPISAMDDYLSTRRHTVPTLDMTASPQSVVVDQPWKSPPSLYPPIEYYFSMNSSNGIISSPNNAAIDKDIEEVVQQCNTLSDYMVQSKQQFISSYSNGEILSTRPLLDDMILKANEVLNALLRIRKHQILSEEQKNEYIMTNSSNGQHQQQQQRSTKRGKRPAFHGRCHSCNISETPEWRRGPDGARTLCNACGLHYAKLAREHQHK